MDVVIRVPLYGFSSSCCFSLEDQGGRSGLEGSCTYRDGFYIFSSPYRLYLGKPMWGTWWVWDARLTSELILLFIYLGIIGLVSAIDDPRTGSRAGAVMTLIGAINIPIIHYSVEWWNTLHQGPTVTKFDSPSIELSMLIPLIIMAVGFMSYFLLVLSYRIQCEILRYDRNANWIRRILR